MLKKKREFKGSRLKCLTTCNGTDIKLSADFSAEILQTSEECEDIFKVLK